MNKGIITFSFDDGRRDTYHVFKDILEPMNIPAVVYIPSGYIETGFNDPLEIGHNGVMTKEELDEIYENKLFEISGHGHMHSNEFNDIEKGLLRLREWYPDNVDFGLASPHSEINRSFVEANLGKYQNMGFRYVRGGRNFEKMTGVKRAVSFAARITKSPLLFRQCYKGSVNINTGFYLHAIPIHKLTTLEQVKGIVDYCVDKKCWGILEFHGIDKEDSMEYQEEFCWLEKDFTALCCYADKLRKEENLFIKTPLQVLRES